MCVWTVASARYIWFWRWIQLWLRSHVLMLFLTSTIDDDVRPMSNVRCVHCVFSLCVCDSFIYVTRAVRMPAKLHSQGLLVSASLCKAGKSFVTSQIWNDTQWKAKPNEWVCVCVWSSSLLIGSFAKFAHKHDIRSQQQRRTIFMCHLINIISQSLATHWAHGQSERIQRFEHKSYGTEKWICVGRRYDIPILLLLLCDKMRAVTDDDEIRCLYRCEFWFSLYCCCC